MFAKEAQKKINEEKKELREKLGRGLTIKEVAKIQEKYFIPGETTRSYEKHMKGAVNAISDKDDDVYESFYEVII